MTEGLVTAFTTSFQQVASDASTMLAIIIPVALSIFGVVWVARKAGTWFSKFSH